MKLKSRTTKISLIVFSMGCILFSYQNCGQPVNFAKQTPIASLGSQDAASLPPKSCTFNGSSLGDSQTTNSYLSSTVPYGTTCVVGSVTCNNGDLIGSGVNYLFDSCSPGAPASCSLLNGATLAHGQSTTLYQAASVPFGNSCVSGPVSCSNGVLSGAGAGYKFGSCSVNPPASCSFNGQSVADGASLTIYKSAAVPYGSTCASELVTCHNGAFDLSIAGYTTTSCSVGPASPCTLATGGTLANGSSTTLYQAASVPYGASCVSGPVSCSNGVLSGAGASYAFNSCSPAAPLPCTFNGQTIASGTSVNAYTSPTVASGSTCNLTPIMCHNGAFDSVPYATCTVNQPPVCTPQTATTLKIMFMIDASGSTYGASNNGFATDKNGVMRTQSITDFVNANSTATNLKYSFSYFSTDTATYDFSSNVQKFVINASHVGQLFGTPAQELNATRLFAQESQAQSASSTPYGGCFADNGFCVAGTNYQAAFAVLQSFILADQTPTATNDYVVIFMSDGQPNGGGTNYPTYVQNVVAAAGGSTHATVSGVFFGPESDATSIKNIKTIASAGGGKFVDTNVGTLDLNSMIQNLIVVPGNACK